MFCDLVFNFYFSFLILFLDIYLEEIDDYGYGGFVGSRYEFYRVGNLGRGFIRMLDRVFFIGKQFQGYLFLVDLDKKVLFLVYEKSQGYVLVRLGLKLLDGLGYCEISYMFIQLVVNVVCVSVFYIVVLSSIVQ